MTLKPTHKIIKAFGRIPIFQVIFVAIEIQIIDTLTAQSTKTRRKYIEQQFGYERL